MNNGKPKLLDLFCGAGGCTKGYQRAGFWVRGIDHKPQPRYVGEEFIQADALEYLSSLIDSGEIEEFQAIHASPPCQKYSNARNYNGLKKRKPDTHPDLLQPTWQFLVETGLPFVVENVLGAKNDFPHLIELCGTAFGLRLQRHRLFGSNILLLNTPRCRHALGDVSIRRHRSEYLLMYSNVVTAKGKKVRRPPHCPINKAREAVGIDWMNSDELGEAIPPAYTEFIGRQLLAAIQAQEKSHAL